MAREQHSKPPRRGGGDDSSGERRRAGRGREGLPGTQPSGGGRRRGASAGPGAANRGHRAYGRQEQTAQRSGEQAKYDGPPIDDSITGRELDRAVRQQLQGLPEKLAARVARHLVAAGRLIEDDPETAYQHALAARARAARLAVVREACGEAAYAAGEYATALAELRAAKRMNGASAYLPMMADCERALGRPDRALSLARSPAVETLEAAQKAEMTIVEAGARRDLGDVEAALRTLENSPLRSRSRAEWVVRLRYAYADALIAAGRVDDATAWFHRAAAIDGDAVTDAAERAAELEGVVVTDAAPGDVAREDAAAEDDGRG